MELLETEIYLRYKQIIESQTAYSLTCHPGLVPGSPFHREKESVQPRHVHMADLLDHYDVFCFDGYGTLYNRDRFVYPGAMEWFLSLRRAGKTLRLVTNAASDVDGVLARAAEKRGFDFSTEETISSGSLLQNLVEQLRSGIVKNAAGTVDRIVSGTAALYRSAKQLELREVYYIGRETGKNVLAACGITAVAMDAEPAEPIVAISSAKDTPETYARAVKILQKPGAVLLVLNSDAWAPKVPDENGVTVREPVSGALSERLRRDSMCEANGGEGCATYYLGKPFPQIWECVKASFPVGSRVLMIGDTLGTDVYGAKIAGFDSALVVGRNVPATELDADEAALGIRPDYYLEP
ncbi:HAD-IIA family hydrolase [Fibrobacter sp. UWB12]|uniref:HAD-IIA family hydrolase n=1 Tax=Fibrobacter sp. UWB12 TaxID=1896203 RepID=UPI000917648A|nr:HAD hydrolase-like protein [Fibrobacter sp. UWB12]SHK20215.1 Haloacid Dehalogenase Superfamily Class (subfamily) IIA [Fibrobacter sp. UWB12]